MCVQHGIGPQFRAAMSTATIPIIYVFIHHSFDFFFGHLVVYSNLRVCIAFDALLRDFFSFSLPSFSLTHAFFLPLSLFGCLFPPICSFLCVKIYVTRGCVGSLYSISQSLCKYYVALIVIEIIYLLRILRVCDACVCVLRFARMYEKNVAGKVHTRKTHNPNLVADKMRKTMSHTIFS